MRIIASIIIALTVAAPVLAQSVRDQLIPVDNPCYGRIYDADHMAAHPDQQIQQIAVTAFGETMNPEGYDVMLHLEVKLRGDPILYHNGGFCDRAGNDLECGLEGDAGKMNLTTRGDQIALVPGSYGIRVWAMGHEEVQFGLPGSDDLLFLLNEGECN
jgi:hypothetical protein